MSSQEAKRTKLEEDKKGNRTMNKKGQVFTPITMVFMVIVFLIVFALFGASFLNLGIGMAMDTGYYTGLEGFLMSNLSVFIFIALIIAIISLGAYSVYNQ